VAFLTISPGIRFGFGAAMGPELACGGVLDHAFSFGHGPLSPPRGVMKEEMDGEHSLHQLFGGLSGPRDFDEWGQFAAS
jgi:hypothetical protein